MRLLFTFIFQFAWVCIEVGVDDEFPESIIVDIESIGEVTVRVEYPWKPKACSICVKFGHRDQECIGIKKVWRPITKSKNVDPLVHLVHVVAQFVSASVNNEDVNVPNSKVGDSEKAQ